MWLRNPAFGPFWFFWYTKSESIAGPVNKTVISSLEKSMTQIQNKITKTKLLYFFDTV